MSNLNLSDLKSQMLVKKAGRGQKKHYVVIGDGTRAQLKRMENGSAVGEATAAYALAGSLGGDSEQFVFLGMFNDNQPLNDNEIPEHDIELEQAAEPTAESRIETLEDDNVKTDAHFNADSGAAVEAAFEKKDANRRRKIEAAQAKTDGARIEPRKPAQTTKVAIQARAAEKKLVKSQAKYEKAKRQLAEEDTSTELQKPGAALSKTYIRKVIAAAKANNGLSMAHEAHVAEDIDSRLASTLRVFAGERHEVFCFTSKRAGAKLVQTLTVQF